MILNNLLFGEDKLVSEWVADKIDIVLRPFENYATIGIMNKENTKLIAGVVYTDYEPEFQTIQLSIAAISPMWARKNTIKAFLSYPFEQLDVFKIWTTTPFENMPALKALKKAGFTREAVLAHQLGKNKHAVMSRMLKTDFNKIYGES